MTARETRRLAFDRIRRRPTAFASLAVAIAIAAASCRAAEGKKESIAALCDGRSASAVAISLVDTVLPGAGEALAVIKNRSFETRLTFQPGATSGAAAGSGGRSGCEGRMGSATFEGEIPEPLRGAASSGSATWRVEGDSIWLDLNPGVRDNNIFMVLPLRGGKGHWSLSTFAGDVVRGATSL